MLHNDHSTTGAGRLSHGRLVIANLIQNAKVAQLIIAGAVRHHPRAIV
jgi:hypothetical protein